MTTSAAPPHPGLAYDAPTDAPFEVVGGVRVEKPMGVYENVVGGIIYEHLVAHARQSGLGRAVVEVKFAIPGSGNQRQPDVGFVSFARWPAARGVPRASAWPVAPDLAVEVISPTDVGFDILAKTHEYFAGGVAAVWQLWSNVFQVHCWTSPTQVRVFAVGDDVAGDPVLPGFRVAVADLFPPPEPAAA